MSRSVFGIATIQNLVALSNIPCFYDRKQFLTALLLKCKHSPFYSAPFRCDLLPPQSFLKRSDSQAVVRKGLQACTQVNLTSVFLKKTEITAFNYRVLFMNSCISTFSIGFNNGHNVSHRDFVHVAFVSSVGFQTFDRIEWYLVE